MQCWFKKFCKEDQNLEDEECSGQPAEVDSDQRRAFIEAGPLTTTQVAEELNMDNFMVIQHLKQIGEVKKLNKVGASWADQIKNIVVLNCLL